MLGKADPKKVTKQQKILQYYQELTLNEHVFHSCIGEQSW